MAESTPQDLGARLIAWTDAVAGRVGDRPAVARFAAGCVALLVAEEVGVAAPGLRAGLSGPWLRRPAAAADGLAAAWRGLADEQPALRGVLAGSGPTLVADEWAGLAALAEHEWAAVEPAILGTLIERCMRADERARLGAWFTPRALIERLARPTIVEPLADEWGRVLAAARGDAGGRAACLGFLERLRGVRVLDPACGAGNFLYVALDLLRDLEAEVLAALWAFGGAGEPRVQPDQLRGIDASAGSCAVAGLVLWLGFVRRGGWRGPVAAADLEVRDALLAWDRIEDVVDERGVAVRVTRQGKRGAGGSAALRRYHGARPAAWPAAEFIVSNPPFIGNKRIRGLLGDGYAEALRAAHADVPGDVDLAAYWWHRAATLLRAGSVRRFGLITTNSVRQAQTGALIRRHLTPGDLIVHAACADLPWTDDAAVRVALTVVRRADEAGARAPVLLEDAAQHPATSIHADLSAGVDVGRAVALAANRGVCFQGMNLVGEGFRLSEADVARLLGDARPAVLRRYLMGRDLKRADGTRYVIDFWGHDLEAARAASPELLRHLESTVKQLRAENSRANYRTNWWLFGEGRPGLRRALSGLVRYVATAETSRFRFFVRVGSEVVPDHQLYAVASDDAYVLGVLSARPHGVWALHAGGRNGAGNDPRWTSSRTFAPYPFPDVTTLQRAEIRGAAERLEAVRAELLARGGSLTDVYHADPPGLRAAQADLDAAVLAAYGWSRAIDERGLLAAVLDLNRARAEEETRGRIRGWR